MLQKSAASSSQPAQLHHQIAGWVAMPSLAWLHHQYARMAQMVETAGVALGLQDAQSSKSRLSITASSKRPTSPAPGEPSARCRRCGWHLLAVP